MQFIYLFLFSFPINLLGAVRKWKGLVSSRTVLSPILMFSRLIKDVQTLVGGENLRIEGKNLTNVCPERKMWSKIVCLPFCLFYRWLKSLKPTKTASKPLPSPKKILSPRPHLLVCTHQTSPTLIRQYMTQIK